MPRSTACWESFAAMLVTFAILFSCSQISRADDSSMAGIGGSLRIMHSNKTIQMVSEVVKITGLPLGQVDATFWLKNTGPATDVTIGFPGYGYNDSPQLSNFRSQVDGTPVKVTMVKSRDTGADDQDQQVWFVKKVHFAANQTHVVRDEYSGGGGDDAMQSKWFSYILHTGSSWKSVIQHATVTADVSGLHQMSITHIDPAGYVRRGSTLTWTFNNLKPNVEDDIRIQYYAAFVNVLVNGAPLWDTTQPSPDWRMHEDWGTAISERRGNDVYLSARCAASWLSATLVVVKPNRVVRIERGGHWVQVTLGSRTIETSSGTTIAMPGASQLGRGSSMFGATSDQYLMAYLKPIAIGLGGKATMVDSADMMYVNMPPVGK